MRLLGNELFQPWNRCRRLLDPLARYGVEHQLLERPGTQVADRLQFRSHCLAPHQQGMQLQQPFVCLQVSRIQSQGTAKLHFTSFDLPLINKQNSFGEASRSARLDRFVGHRLKTSQGLRRVTLL